MDRSVNLRGMIHLNQVEDLLSEILTRLNGQEDSIERISMKLQNMMSLDVAEKSIGNLEDAVRLLSNRIDSLRQSCTVRLNGKIVSASDLSAQNNMKLVELEGVLSSCARSDYVKTRLAELTNQHVTDLQELESRCASAETARSLVIGLRECSARVSRLEEALSQKMERSEIRHVESLVSNLESYSEFKEYMLTRVSDLETGSQSLLCQIQKQTQALSALDDQFVSVTGKCDSARKRTQERVEEVAEEVSRQGRFLRSSCARVEDVRDLEEWKQTAAVEAEDRRVEIAEVRSQIQTLSTVLESKAESDEVRKVFLRRDDFGEVVRALGSDLDGRATQNDLLGAMDQIANIRNSLQQQESQLRVAMRFVDWFTQRGDTYEYNMRIIDKHLKGLASSAISQSKSEPYAGKVRHIPLDELLKQNKGSEKT